MAARRKPYHHGDLANALLEATATLVAERGVQGFSLREAAREVGVDPSACYRHFKNREDLLDTFAARGFEKLGVIMEKKLSAIADRPPPDQLRVMARAYLKFAFEYPAWFRVMFGPRGVDVRVPISGQPSTYSMLLELVRAWNLNIPEVGTEEQAVVLWSGVHGITVLALDGALPATPKERERYLDSFVQVAIAGLATESR